MRGIDHQQNQIFSYLSPETRVRKDHPLRAIRAMVDEALAALSRHLQVTPHVAQNQGRPGGSAIDARPTRHEGYGISQIKRKRIEECFGWLKTIALLRQVRYRGIFKVDWIFTFACAAYNLVRMRNLVAAVPAV